MPRRKVCVLAALFMLGFCVTTVAADESELSTPPDLLTNLAQLRRYANHESSVVHPFRIIAEVCDLDAEVGAVALRDASDIEFIQLDLRNQKLNPGATVCFEGNVCAFKTKSFGLNFTPGLVVENDGIHAMNLESGSVFLHSGLNPIRVQCFNSDGAFNLSVSYAGPNLPRQRIPGSVLARAESDPQRGKTNFYAGVDCRCVEGDWQSLPDFTKLKAVKTGVATNFDLGLRTRNEFVGLEFNGYIRIPRNGVYTFYIGSDDGSRLFAGESSVSIRELTGLPSALQTQSAPLSPERNNRRWVTMKGTVSFSGIWETGGELHMRVGNEHIRVEVFATGSHVPNFPPNAKVRASGVYEDLIAEDGSHVPGRLMVCNWNAVHLLPASDGDQQTTNRLGIGSVLAAITNANPVSATIAEIKALPADVAKKHLPVSIRGVVTAAFAYGAAVQDSTKGIFVTPSQTRDSEPLKRGEFCQIDGVTDAGGFAPQIIVRQITHLGSGQLPQPLHATLDQLMNGSLDTQYTEIEGIVTAAHNRQIEILTEGGKITLGLNQLRAENLAAYENALVQIQGCVFGPFNGETHKIVLTALPVADAIIKVIQPAPSDCFDAPQKRIGELLFYDPKAATFRRLKVSGQIIYRRAEECFLADGTNGMHVTARSSTPFAVGDLVDAVGFLALRGPAIELREAVMRKTGHAPLPAPTKLTREHLLQAGYAGTLVRMTATLMNQWREGADQVLELQSGFFAFRGRIDTSGEAVSLPPNGSLLELTGVYSPRGIGLGDGKVNSFDLLLDSSKDIRILKTPSWWTLKRVLILSTILAVLLCVILLWNKELQRMVQERGRQLEIEVRHRQRAELQRAAEAERSRIARDLHDELGAGLTAVSLLASAGLGECRGSQKINGRLHTIAEKARSLVAALDVIVWAIDPGRNSLQSFANYLRSYARELLSDSNIACHFRIPNERDGLTLEGPVRHTLLLAIKEALNNVIRHASATEVKIQIVETDRRLDIVISDNGHGFDLKTIRRGHGLTNLQQRMEALHGYCQIETQPGKGTIVRFILPLPQDPTQEKVIS